MLLVAEDSTKIEFTSGYAINRSLDSDSAIVQWFRRVNSRLYDMVIVASMWVDGTKVQL